MSLSKSNKDGSKKLKVAMLGVNTVENSNNSSTVFQEIRPFCIQLSKIAFLDEQKFQLISTEGTELIDALKNVESVLQKYQHLQLSRKFCDYVFVPIGSLLKHDQLSIIETQYVLLIIQHLLKSCLEQEGYFETEFATQLFPLITYLISHDKENSQLESKSLQFKLIACNVLAQYFTSLSQQKYSEEFFSGTENKLLATLGHSIVILLDILQQCCADIEVTFGALNALDILYHEVVNDGEILSFVLPGNVSTFTKILVMPGVTVNYKIVARTLKVLRDLLIIVYNDVDLGTTLDSSKNMNTIVENLDEEVKLETTFALSQPVIRNDGKHRNLSWLKATSMQIAQALNSFLPKLLKRENGTINKELEVFASSLLKECSLSLEICSEKLISVLCYLQSQQLNVLSGQSNAIKSITREKVTKIDEFIKFENNSELESIVFGISLMNNEDAILAVCEAIEQVVKSLQNGKLMLKQNYNTSVVVQSSNVIVDSISMDQSQKSSSIMSDLSTTSEKALVQFLSELGGIIVSSERIDDVIEILLSDNIRSTQIEKLNRLWVASNLLAKTSSSVNDFLSFKDAESSEICESCFTILEYTNERFRELILQMEGNQMNRLDEQSLCIMLSAIQIVSNYMGKEFQYELIDSLNIVVEMLANNSPLVRDQAQMCATAIANNLYSGSIQQMIIDNVDYLVEAVSKRLNAGMTERVSTVLMVVCKMAGYEIIQNFQDVFETVFKLLDYYHGYADLCLQFFQLFEIIVLEMKKLYLNDSNWDKSLSDHHLVKSSFSPWGLSNVNQIITVLDTLPTAIDGPELKVDEEPKNFEEYFRNQQIREVDSDDEDEEKAEEVESEVWESPLPKPSYETLLKIMHYCDRLLLHSSKPLRVQVLKVIKLIVPMLATQYDSLLPQVAQIWDTVAQNCLHQDMSIAMSACECAEVIIFWSNNFISKRFIELWDTMKSKSYILKEIKPHGTTSVLATSGFLSLHRNFPPITKNALVAMSKMLVQGILVTEQQLPETTVEDMIYCCIHVLPHDLLSSKSMLIADIIYNLTQPDQF